MPGHAHTSTVVLDDAHVHVAVPGRENRPIQIVAANPPRNWTPEEVQQAVESQQQKAGPLVALVRDRIEATWSEIRRELNEAAGGQASARVMVLAHHAMRAHQALELQSLLAEVDAGGNGRAKADPNNGLRNQSGLSVIATQALNQAYEAARAEAKQNQGSPTQQLMSRLGVPAPREVVPPSPVRPPGGDQVGSPPVSIPPSPEEPE